MKTIENKIKAIIKERNIEQLCEMFEITNDNNDLSIPIIRGMIMNELENRDQAKFDKWIDENDPEKMDFPSIFFCN